MTTHYQSLAAHSSIVADTGNVDAIRQFQPEDATTNPSLMLAAASDPKFDSLVSSAISWGVEQSKAGKSSEDIISLTMDKLAVTFGAEILSIVKGYVSTEVDARLSFDTQANVDRARRIIAMYEDAGYTRDRVLIKIAATWEGIRAAEILEQEGIHCNLTLLFSFAQAVACAEANVTLISPFVGRIMDWYSAKTGSKYEDATTDPGVKSVTQIYNYYKQHGYKTIVMGASFRNINEIIELTGCDKLTISPKLLTELTEKEGELQPRLTPPTTTIPKPEVAMTEQVFRWDHNGDAMATEKLAEGIRNFATDCEKLEKIVIAKLKEQGVEL